MKKLLAIFFWLGSFGIIGSCQSLPAYKYTRLEVPAFQTMAAETIPVYISDRFSEEDKLAIDDAIMQWNYVLNDQVKLEVVDADFHFQIDVLKAIHQQDKGIVILRTDSSSLLIPEPVDVPNATSENTVAWTTGSGHELYVIRDRIADRITLEGILLHELGHTLGAGHNKFSPSLMNPSYSLLNGRCVDKWSAQMVAVALRIDAGAVNYCVLEY